MAGEIVLVVEDNAVNMMLMRDVLEFAGYRVSGGASVDEGRARLEEGHLPALVLLDIQLPGGGGEVLLRYIRATPRLAALPVVAVTAFAMTGDRERYLHAGFDDYLSKPIDVRRLPRQVAEWIDRAAGAG